MAALLTLGGMAAANDVAPEPTVNINQADAATLAQVLHGVGIGLATVDRNQARIRISDER